MQRMDSPPLTRWALLWEYNRTTLATMSDDILYWGTDHKIHYLRLCPLAKLPDLHKLFALLNEEYATANEHHHYPTKEGLLIHCSAVRGVCDEILRINGIDPAHVSIRQAIDFCLGSDTEPPMLAKLNGLSGDDEPVDRDEIEGSLQSMSAHLLGVLMAAGQSYEAARKIIEDYPLEGINAILEGIVGKSDKKSNGLPKTEKGKQALLQELMRDFSKIGDATPKAAKAPLGGGLRINKNSPPPSFFKR